MEKYILIYFALISAVSIVVTIADKVLAIHRGRRVPEATLLTLSAMGGSVAMYITMQIIRHKTRELKFMLGIPVIMALQCALIFAVLYLGERL